MVSDGQKLWKDGRNGRTQPKTIPLGLCRGYNKEWDQRLPVMLLLINYVPHFRIFSHVVPVELNIKCLALASKALAWSRDKNTTN